MKIELRYGPEGRIERKIMSGWRSSGSLWPDGYFSVARAPIYRWAEISFGEAGRVADAALALGSVKVNNHHKGVDFSTPPVRMYGENGITRLGRRKVRAGCWLLTYEYPGIKKSFATLTVPRLSPEDEARVVARWGEIVRRFCQSLKRVVEQSGRNWRYVAVTEVQPKRWAERGEIGLHLHIVYLGGDRRGWYVKPKKLRQCWRRAVCAVIEGRYDFSSCENVKRVKGNLAGYLSKYLSKGAKEIREIREKYPLLPIPAQWWSIDSATRYEIECLVCRDPSVTSFVEQLGCSYETTGIFSLFNEIVVDINDSPAYVGASGYLTRSGYDFVMGCCYN